MIRRSFVTQPSDHQGWKSEKEKNVENKCEFSDLLTLEKSKEKKRKKIIKIKRSTNVSELLNSERLFGGVDLKNCSRKLQADED